ncbi:hypothetical protein TIFTF001_002139 [Ficus carica]|uniref:Uncharacterized protein n=1 Tax=Ficus carica TaxID=3494 RepID=A0AA87Z3C6_FICCA|nr:hypothetical protein TIFTF001_002139 [Ficus carica]
MSHYGTLVHFGKAYDFALVIAYCTSIPESRGGFSRSLRHGPTNNLMKRERGTGGREAAPYYIVKGGATAVYLKDIMSRSNVDMPKVSTGTVVSFVRFIAPDKFNPALVTVDAWIQVQERVLLSWTFLLLSPCWSSWTTTYSFLTIVLYPNKSCMKNRNQIYEVSLRIDRQEDLAVCWGDLSRKCSCQNSSDCFVSGLKWLNVCNFLGTPHVSMSPLRHHVQGLLAVERLLEDNNRFLLHNGCLISCTVPEWERFGATEYLVGNL